jgi:hypothetical protein
LPVGVTVANIGTATLVFTTNSSQNLPTNTYYIYPPKSSSSNAPTYYIDNSNTSIIDTSDYQTFQGTGQNGSTYTITITEQLKDCISRG